jgi:hypothetical protein
MIEVDSTNTNLFWLLRLLGLQNKNCNFECVIHVEWSFFFNAYAHNIVDFIIKDNL